MGEQACWFIGRLEIFHHGTSLRNNRKLLHYVAIRHIHALVFCRPVRCLPLSTLPSPDSVYTIFKRSTAVLRSKGTFLISRFTEARVEDLWMGRKLLGIGDEDGHLGGLSFLPWIVEEIDLVLRSNVFYGAFSSLKMHVVTRLDARVNLSYHALLST